MWTPDSRNRQGLLDDLQLGSTGVNCCLSVCEFVVNAAKLHVNQRWRFGDDARMDDAGVLKGVRNPGNIKMWINPLGPGQYPTVDGMEQAAKAGGSHAC